MIHLAGLPRKLAVSSLAKSSMAKSSLAVSGLILFALLFALIGLVPKVGAGYLADTDSATKLHPDFEPYAYALASDDPQEPILGPIETITPTVTLTISVTVPGFTPGTVYITGNQPELGDWDPGAIPMTQSEADTWTVTLDFLENTLLAFNFGRGSEETEETENDGNTPVPSREVTVTYGVDGTQSESFTVANWRDPIVVNHFPVDGASSLHIDTPISASWSQAMGVGTDFQVIGLDGPISGTFTYYVNTYTYVFTPSHLLSVGESYTATVAEQTDAGGDSQQVSTQFSFDTLVPTSVELVALRERPTIADSWWWVSWPWLMVLLTAVSLSGLVWIKRRKRQAIPID